MESCALRFGGRVNQEGLPKSLQPIPRPSADFAWPMPTRGPGNCSFGQRLGVGLIDVVGEPVGVDLPAATLVDHQLI
jgi:hypothetical protein